MTAFQHQVGVRPIDDTARRLAALRRRIGPLPAPGAQALRLDFWGERTTLTTAPSTVIQYVREYFESYRPGSDASLHDGTWRIHAAQLADLDRLIPLFNGAPTVITEHGRVERALKGPTETAFLLPPAQYVVLIDRRKKSVFACAAHSQALSNVVTRINRQVLSSSLEEYSRFVMHGSGIDYQRKGALFIGDKGNGKTTLFLALLLRLTGARSIGNDRIILQKVKNKIEMQVWPHKWGVCRDSFEFLPEMKSSRLAERFRAGFSKEYFTPRTVTEDLGLLRQRKASLYATFLLHLDPRATRPHIEAVPTSVATERLRPHMIRFVNDEAHPPWLGLQLAGGPKSDVAAEQLIDAVSRRAVFDLRVTSDLDATIAAVRKGIESSKV